MKREVCLDDVITPSTPRMSPGGREHKRVSQTLTLSFLLKHLHKRMESVSVATALRVDVSTLPV